MEVIENTAAAAGAGLGGGIGSFGPADITNSRIERNTAISDVDETVTFEISRVDDGLIADDEDERLVTISIEDDERRGSFQLDNLLIPAGEPDELPLRAAGQALPTVTLSAGAEAIKERGGAGVITSTAVVASLSRVLDEDVFVYLDVGGIATLGEDFTLGENFTTRPEVEPNDSVATAQDLDPFGWFRVPAAGEEGATHELGIQGTGNGTYDYYRFTVAAGAEVVFDIEATSPDDVDTEIFLFDALGNKLAENDDRTTTDRDSRLEHRFESAGTYVLGVSAFRSSANVGGITGDALQSGDKYVLRMSVEDDLHRPTLRIPAGQSSASFQVTAIDDDVSENITAGGGIFAEAKGDDRVTIVDSIIAGNQSNEGGGILNNEGANLTIVGSKILDNSAVSSVEARLLDTALYTAGGGIFTLGEMILIDSEVSGNEAGVGGGIEIDPGLPGFEVRIENSLISGNTAKSGEYSAGGGIRNGNALEPGQVVTIVHSTITENFSSFEGGGITNGGTLNIHSSTISHNRAGAGGGIGNWGIANIDHSTVSHNVADASLDDVVVDLAQLIADVITRATGNEVSREAVIEFAEEFDIAPELTYESGDGGGIYTITIDPNLGRAPFTFPDGSSFEIQELSVFGPNARATITNSTITQNHADLAGGGIIASGAPSHDCKLDSAWQHCVGRQR